MKINVNIKGLKNVLLKYNDNGKIAKGKHWEIGKGGYDLWWEISYDGFPIIGCVCGEIENYGHLNYGKFKKICNIIFECYGRDDCIIENM